MAWIGAHFAIGVAGGGAIAAGICAVRKRGWKSVPIAMLAGGVWAVIPDLPRIVRDDLSIGLLTATIGSPGVIDWFHQHGNWFFLHRWVDVQAAQPWPEARWGLRGLAVILICYNLLAVGLYLANDRLTAVVRKLRVQLDLLGPSVAASSSAADAAIEADAAPPLRLADADQPSRRRYPRLPSGDDIAAVMQDPSNQHLASLANAKLIDVSAEGVAISTTTPVESGATIYIRHKHRPADGDRQLQAVVLERMPYNDRHKIRCRALRGPQPTQMFKQAA